MIKRNIICFAVQNSIHPHPIDQRSILIEVHAKLLYLNNSLIFWEVDFCLEIDERCLIEV